jgi:DNA-directed RNA polymerase specialized sigma24 family protein
MTVDKIIVNAASAGVLDTQEIADMVGLSLDATKQRKLRALRKASQ